MKDFFVHSKWLLMLMLVAPLPPPLATPSPAKRRRHII